MNEREALLRAVCDNPDDDTPRLVFADWLDENGEPERAEFIRLQCQRAQGLTAEDSLNGFTRRMMRELTLWEEFGDRWVAELPSSDAPELDWGGLFERGFAGDMLRIKAIRRVGPDDAWIEYEGTDCSALDWERLLWSAPITRLYLWDLRNWGVVFNRPEAVHLKSVLLYDCGVDADTIVPLLHWAIRTPGHLVVKQEALALDCGRQLHAAFAGRFEWTTPRFD